MRPNDTTALSLAVNWSYSRACGTSLRCRACLLVGARKALTFLPPDDVVVGMKLRAGFVYSAVILIFFGALYLLTKAFDLLNRPSDTSVFYGILIIVALVALVPSALHWVWHHHMTPHAEPQAPFTRKKENDANT
jgi:hypothetical protein